MAGVWWSLGDTAGRISGAFRDGPSSLVRFLAEIEFISSLTSRRGEWKCFTQSRKNAECIFGVLSADHLEERWHGSLSSVFGVSIHTIILSRSHSFVVSILLCFAKDLMDQAFPEVENPKNAALCWSRVTSFVIRCTAPLIKCLE